MWARGSWTARFALAIAATGIAAAFAPAVTPDKWRVLALLGAILFCPGYAILRIVPRLSRGDGVSLLAMAFPLSCAFWIIPLFAYHLLGGGPELIRGAAIPVLALSAAVFLFRFRSSRESPPAPLWLLFLILVLVPFTAGRGASVNILSDSLDHIAYLGAIDDSWVNFPDTAYYADPSDQSYDIRKGFLQPVLAAGGRLAGADASMVWSVLPTLVAVFFSFSLFALARAAFGTGLASNATLFAGLLTNDSGILSDWFGRSGIPFLFTAPAVWCVFLLLIRSSKCDRNERGILFFLAFLFGFAVMGMHLFAVVAGAALTSVYLLAFAIARRGEGRLGGPLSVGAGFLLGAIPIGIWRFLTSYPPIDPIHTHLQGVVWVGKGLYFSAPQLALNRFGLLGIAAIPLSLLLWKKAGKEDGALFAFSTTLLPYLIVLNPLLVPVLAPLFGYLIGRIVWYGGNYMVIGAVVALLARHAKPGYSTMCRTASLGALATMIILYSASAFAGDRQRMWKSLSLAPAFHQEVIKPDLWKDLFHYMDESLEPMATVATDPITAYMIPALTKQKIIGLSAQHSAPSDPDAQARLKDVALILSPYIDGAKTAAILERRRADYVLLNFRYPRIRTLFYGAVDPSLYDATLQKFRSEPDRYTEIFGRDRCHLFRLEKRGDPGTVRESILTASIQTLPPETNEVGHIFPNGVRLVAATVLNDHASPDEDLRIVCYWNKANDSQDPHPYRLYVRLDPLDGKAVNDSKLRRKLREVIDGKRYRARTGRNLLRGAYPPFAWNEGETVADTLIVPISPRLAEGNYRIEILLRRHPHLQTYEIQDFWKERDSFSGVPVGTVAIGETGHA